MERDGVRLPAAFGARFEIMNGVYPAFADCTVGVKPGPSIMGYVSRKFGLGLGRFENEGPSAGGALFECLLFSFPNSVSGGDKAGRQGSGLEARTLFDSSGVWICRPGPSKSCRMGVAIKGGNNNEHHNHNDVGSFVVAIGSAAPLLDPGAEIYTARTFSPRRYDSGLLNSHGHPVPLVAGALQETGADARGTVLSTRFADVEDALVMDIRAAYGVKELTKLVRTFVYSRAGTGSLTVTDEVEFSTPKAFGTALITLGAWKEEQHGRLLVSDNGGFVLVDIKVEGSEFDIKAEEIREEARTPKRPTRIGIDLRTPVTRATVTLKISPDFAE